MISCPGRRSICVVADVSNEEHVQSMVKTTVEALGQLNVRQLLHPASYLTVYVGDDCERRNYRAQALSGA